MSDLDHALTCLAREDPSLRVVSDPESGRVGVAFSPSGSSPLRIRMLLDNTERHGRIAS